MEGDCDVSQTKRLILFVLLGEVCHNWLDRAEGSTLCDKRLCKEKNGTLENPSTSSGGRYLGETGGRGQVRELEALLSDSDVSEEARMALEQIPDSEAEKALERASESGPPACRAACRQSLRKRRRAMRDAGIRRRGRF